jgi:hypothetical protein
MDKTISIYILPAPRLLDTITAIISSMQNKTMRYILITALLMILTAAACTPVSQEPSPPPAAATAAATNPAEATAAPTDTATAISTEAATAAATRTPTPTPHFTSTPQPAPTSTEAALENFRVRYHPDWALFSGDLVSFEVIAPAGFDSQEQSVQIQVIDPIEQDLGSAQFGAFGIGGRIQATFVWTWDTGGLRPGPYRLLFQVSDGTAWEEEIILHPREAMTPPEPEAAWASAESECCIIHYMTGTEGERDLDLLLDEAHRQAELTARRMQAEFAEPVVITILPRVLGHGGFAGGEISVSYLDRNYAGSDFPVVLHHEMVHILDGRLGGELRPSILVEGLAVYLTGGHYKIEPMMSRAAALLEIPSQGEDPHELGWFIPLWDLAEAFYPAQHEIGYIQAGALVQYMVERWGWEGFETFYRSIPHHESVSQAFALDQALQSHFGMTLGELEQDFLAVLRQELVTANHIEDVRLTVLYYDTLRRYQRMYDESAYFRTAWLLSNEDMRRRDIVADYLRRPEGGENIAVEALLVSANEHLSAGDYVSVQRYLDAANTTMDVLAEEAEAVP